MFEYLPRILAAAEGGTDQGNNLGQTLMYVGMIVVFGLIFYFFMYRPQKKQEREAASMRDNLKIGDEISTTGGILGRVVKIKDDVITIETGSDKNKLKIFKWAVRAVEIPVDGGEEEPAKSDKAEKKESKKDKAEDK